MIERKCPNCDTRYFGWALRFPRNQSCSDCGAALIIYENGKPVSDGYSPFTAERYLLNLPAEVDKSKIKAKNRTRSKKHHS
jgi:hypothetical protein